MPYSNAFARYASGFRWLYTSTVHGSNPNRFFFMASDMWSSFLLSALSQISEHFEASPPKNAITRVSITYVYEAKIPLSFTEPVVVVKISRSDFDFFNHHCHDQTATICSMPLLKLSFAELKSNFTLCEKGNSALLSNQRHIIM